MSVVGKKKFPISPDAAEKEMIAALESFARAVPETLKTDHSKVDTIITLLRSQDLAAQYAPEEIHALCAFLAQKILDAVIKKETLEAIIAEPPDLSALDAIKARASTEQLVFDQDHPALSDMYRLLSAIWKNDKGMGQSTTALKQIQTELAVLHALEEDSSRATEETRTKTLEIDAVLKDVKKENVALKEALERKATSLEEALKDVSSKSDTINRRAVSLEAAMRDVSQRSNMTSRPAALEEEADTADSIAAKSRTKRAAKGRMGVGRVAPDLQKKFEEEALKMYTFNNGVWLPKPVPGEELDRLAKLVIEL
jgi:hypothetical protein